MKLAQRLKMGVMTAPPPPQSGEEIFTSSGTWIVPEGVTNMDVICVGKGGDSVRASGGGGGGGVVVADGNTISAGQSYTITIDANMSELRRTSTGNFFVAYAGDNASDEAGGDGGRGNIDGFAPSSSSISYGGDGGQKSMDDNGGGGGGAGGYEDGDGGGKGGNGAQGYPAESNSGAGGGGGAYFSDQLQAGGGGGGGVGVNGKGNDGVAGDPAYPPGGGGNGSNGQDGFDTIDGRLWGASGGDYGGGAGGCHTDESGLTVTGGAAVVVIRWNT